MHVVLLHDELSADARPDESDVLVQVEAVSAALRDWGHHTTSMGLTLDLNTGARRLAELKPDLAFNLVEALGGQGRLIYLAPALLDSLHIPYTGARTEAMFLTSSKTVTKRMLRLNDLPTPPWAVFHVKQVWKMEDSGHPARTGRIENICRTVEIEKRRWIIKSVWEEASVGLDEDSVVSAADEAELAGHVAKRLTHIGGEGFAEAYIDGREFNLALLADPRATGGCEVLPPAEIEFLGYGADKPRVVGYRAKWVEGSFEYRHTVRKYEFGGEDAALLERLRELAAQCWTVFDLRGYARVDFRVDAEGRPWILEINANPCISPDAGFIAASTRRGLSYQDVVQRIIADV